MTPCSWASNPRRFGTIAVPPCSETSSVSSQKDRVHRNSAVNTSVSPHSHRLVVSYLYICTEQPFVWRSLGRFTSRKPGFSPRRVYVGFMAGKVALVCVILWVLRFLPEGHHCIGATQSHLSVYGTDSECLRDGTRDTARAPGGHSKWQGSTKQLY